MSPLGPIASGRVGPWNRASDVSEKWGTAVEVESAINIVRTNTQRGR